MKFTAEQKDCLQELINVAMGQTSDKLARFLNTLVHLQVPAIALVQSSEIPAQLQRDYADKELAMVSQGFLGDDGINGEALVLYQLESADAIARLLGYEQDSASEMEMLTDISAILNSTFLNGLGAQLGLQLSYSAPRLLWARQQAVSGPLLAALQHWELALKVDISYKLTDYAFHCDMFLLIPGEAVGQLQHILNQILERY